MTKSIYIIIVFVVLLLILFGCMPTQSKTDYLRIHIRADSNNTADQSVKYAVKQAIVDYLTPYLAQCNTKSQAMAVVKQQLKNIENVCDKVLSQAGFSYKATARLKQEDFPERAYNNVVLPSGVYDALIINLGSGQGNNWWCVVYPPLCFVEGTPTGDNAIVYRSKLLEIINNWKNSR